MVSIPDSAFIEKIILKKLEALKPGLNPDAQTLLYAKDGVLSSIELVMLIVDVEQEIRADYKTTLVLASPKAMSQKNSPFHSVTSFTNFIFEELNSQPK